MCYGKAITRQKTEERGEGNMKKKRQKEEKKEKGMREMERKGDFREEESGCIISLMNLL